MVEEERVTVARDAAAGPCDPQAVPGRSDEILGQRVSDGDTPQAR